MDDLLTLLKSTGLPVAYHHFDAPPAPPYIVYLSPDTQNFFADNRVYCQIENYQVELYTVKKDPASEALLEGLFNANDIPWDKNGLYLEGEKLYQVVYEIPY